MNKCLIEILDPQRKTRTPAKAYLCVSSTEDVTLPNARVYAADIGLPEMALMLWSAEYAIKSCCEQVAGLRKLIDEAHETLDESAVEAFDTTSILYHPEGMSDDSGNDDK